MGGLATQERALPTRASNTALRRLAAPALEFTKHVPNLARALEIGVRDALADGLMLVPSAVDKSNTSRLLWVPASRGSGRSGKDGPPVVQQHASAMARAAEGVAPGVRTARAALDQHQVRDVDPARRAAAQARSHVGAARAQLRQVLGQQAGTFPFAAARASAPGTGRAGVRARPLNERADRSVSAPPITWPGSRCVRGVQSSGGADRHGEPRAMVTLRRRFGGPVTVQATEPTVVALARPGAG